MVVDIQIVNWSQRFRHFFLINNTQDLLMIRGVCITFENLDSIFINGLDHEIWLTNEKSCLQLRNAVLNYSQSFFLCKRGFPLPIKNGHTKVGCITLNTKVYLLKWSQIIQKVQLTANAFIISSQQTVDLKGPFAQCSCKFSATKVGLRL